MIHRLKEWIKQVVIMVSMVVVLVVPMAGSDEVSLTTTLMVARDGALMNADAERVMVRLRCVGCDGADVLWEKEYEGVLVRNGEMKLELSGVDRHGDVLVSEMFDQPKVQLEVEIEDEVVGLEMMVQPYAIKTRISDETHSARGLQGIPVRAVSQVNENDILMIKDGVWVASGKGDGYTGTASEEARENVLSAMEDVRIRGLNEGDILGYNGSEWTNVTDESLSKRDIDKIVRNKGYLKEVGMNTMGEGEYEEIQGIGGKIRVVDGIEMSGQVMVQGGVKVSGEMGGEDQPIKGMYVRELMIKGEGEGIEMKEEASQLKVSELVKVAGKRGVLMSGQGGRGGVGVYQSETEMMSDGGLKWDRGLKQLWMGDVSELNGIKMNVDGGMRVSGDVVLGDELVNFSDYLRFEDIANVATSGKYSDIENRPDLGEYTRVEKMEEILASDQYTREELGGEIERRIGAFNDGGLQTMIESQLGGYDPRVVREEKVTERMRGYQGKEKMGEVYVDHGELDDALTMYASTEKLRGDILVEYMKESEMSDVGKSGSYRDITDWPVLVSKEDYESDKVIFEEVYATKAGFTDKLMRHSDAMRALGMSEVMRDYVSHAQLNEEGYATKETVGELSEVGRTGEYEDILGRPDMNVYMEGSEIDANYMDQGELDAELIKYIKNQEVSEVGKTGAYEDMVNEPDMARYQRVEAMSGYVRKRDFDGEMMGVQRTGSLPDLSVYEKKSDAMSKLEMMAKKEVLKAVAFSGEYRDLMGIDRVIEQGELDEKMGLYASKDELASERERADRLYFDEGELNDKLGVFNGEVEGSRGTTFGEGHYTKSQMNDRISSDLESHRGGELVPAINAALSDSVPKTTLSARLQQDHIAESQVPGMVASEMSDRVLNTHYQSYKATLATYDDMNAWLPSGAIVMWNGTTPPAGWVLCNSNNKTIYGAPDLSGRFIVNTGGGYSKGNTGGSETFTITTQHLPSHSHRASSDQQLGSHHHSGSSSNDQTDSHTHTGTIDNGGASHTHAMSAASNESDHHQHTGSSSNKNQFHDHGDLQSVGNHTHNDLFTSLGQKVVNDDFNNSGGVGPSSTLGAGDNGYYYTGDGGNHAHTVNNGGGNHRHSLSVGNNSANHNHTFGSDQRTASHSNHALSNVSTHSKTHRHTLSIPSNDLRHNHDITTTDTGGAGASFTSDNRPPYYTLAFIMKL